LDRLERLLQCGRHCCTGAAGGCNDAAEKDMKIYLLMTLIGTLLTAVRFTSMPKRQSKTLPRSPGLKA
jgi:hypothetical protein